MENTAEFGFMPGPCWIAGAGVRGVTHCDGGFDAGPRGLRASAGTLGLTAMEVRCGGGESSLCGLNVMHEGAVFNLGLCACTAGTWRRGAEAIRGIT
jgi:hypothetical protein